MNNNINALCQKELKICSYECDAQRRWKASSMFVQFTDLASTHANLLGVGLQEFDRQDLFWVLSRIKLEIFCYPCLGQQVFLRTWPKGIQQKLFYLRDFELVDEEGVRLVGGSSAWLIIKGNTRQLMPPRALPSLVLPCLPDRHGLNTMLEKLPKPSALHERLRVQAAYSAIDLVGHVNNSRYVEWVFDSLDYALFDDQEVAGIEMNYEHEVRPKEEVAIYSTEDDPSLISFSGENLSTGKQAFRAQLCLRPRRE